MYSSLPMVANPPCTKAAQVHPELEVFASLSSHAPTFEYCPSMLNDEGNDVDWTRVGHYIGNATRARSNFYGS